MDDYSVFHNKILSSDDNDIKGKIDKIHALNHDEKSNLETEIRKFINKYDTNVCYDAYIYWLTEKIPNYTNFHDKLKNFLNNPVNNNIKELMERMYNLNT